MDVQLRPAGPGDYRITEELTREAFWGLNRPDCDEHLLAHKLRKSQAYVPELDYVAEVDGKIVGNVIYSLGRVACEGGCQFEVLNFGPLSVLPDYQGQGVGSALMRRTIAEAKRMGYRAILFFGHPDYYPRFGFTPAERYHITTSEGKNFDAFMAMPLYDGALDGISGRYYEDAAFELDAEEAAEFDRGFPHKQKRAFAPIDTLLKRLPAPAQDAIRRRCVKEIAGLMRYSGREIKAWRGIGEAEMAVINQTLQEYGYAAKVLTWR